MKRLMFLLAFAGMFLVTGSAFAKKLFVPSSLLTACKKREKLCGKELEQEKRAFRTCALSKGAVKSHLSACKSNLASCKGKLPLGAAYKARNARYQWEARALLYFYCKTYQKNLPAKVKKGKPDMRQFCQAFLKKKGVSTIPAVYKSAHMKELKWFFGYMKQRLAAKDKVLRKSMANTHSIFQAFMRCRKKSLRGVSAGPADYKKKYNALQKNVVRALYKACLWKKKNRSSMGLSPRCKQLLKGPAPKGVQTSLDVFMLSAFIQVYQALYMASDKHSRQVIQKISTYQHICQRYRTAALEARKSAFNLIYNTCHYAGSYLATPQRTYCAKTLPKARKGGWNPKAQLRMVPLRWVNKRIQGLSGKLGDLCSLLKKKNIKHPHCK